MTPTIDQPLTRRRALIDTYNDPDGEYTSGKTPIGDVYYNVSPLVDDQASGENG